MDSIQFGVYEFDVESYCETEIDLSEHFKESEWNEMTPEEQYKWLEDTAHDIWKYGQVGISYDRIRDCKTK